MARKRMNSAWVYQGKLLERVAVGHGESRCTMRRDDLGGSSAPTQPQPNCPDLPQCLGAKSEAEFVDSTTLAAWLANEEFVAVVN